MLDVDFFQLSISHFEAAATPLVFVGSKEYTNFHFHVIYLMTKCNKTNNLKQCHKYKGSDKEACYII